jgi:hypothetical protein
MFCVDEPTAEAIRRAYAEDGEWLAMVELRRHFPLIRHDANGLRCLHMIAGWQPPAPAEARGQVIPFPETRRTS